MVTINRIHFCGNQNLSGPQNTVKKDEAPPLKPTHFSTLENVPAFAWRANKLPFGSVKIPVEDFKTKMQDKIDKIRQGTYQRAKVDKAELNIQKRDAVKNITGPLKLVCEGLDTKVLNDLNKDFTQIKNANDLYKLLSDPRIPDDTPIVITENSTTNYDKFMAEVVKGNELNDVEKTTAVVQEALNKMDGNMVEMPEIAIKVSRKELAKSLIKHTQAGLDYDGMSIVASPYFAFVSGDELAIDLIKPVYAR